MALFENRAERKDLFILGDMDKPMPASTLAVMMALAAFRLLHSICLIPTLPKSLVCSNPRL